MVVARKMLEGTFRFSKRMYLHLTNSSNALRKFVLYNAVRKGKLELKNKSQENANENKLYFELNKRVTLKNNHNAAIH